MKNFPGPNKFWPNFFPTGELEKIPPKELWKKIYPGPPNIPREK